MTTPAPSNEQQRLGACRQDGGISAVSDVVESTEPTLRILIADDQDVIRELIFAALEGDSRFQLIGARNGQEAVDAAREVCPDMAILDIKMPLLDGLSACATLRAAEATSHIPILMLTAYNQTEDLERARTAGATDYFVKPFVPSDLLSKVYDLLDARSA